MTFVEKMLQLFSGRRPGETSNRRPLVRGQVEQTSERSSQGALMHSSHGTPQTQIAQGGLASQDIGDIESQLHGQQTTQSGLANQQTEESEFAASTQHAASLPFSSHEISRHEDDESEITEQTTQDAESSSSSTVTLLTRKELQRAARDGNWAAVQTKLQNSALTSAIITDHKETILHLAVLGKHASVIEGVVDRMQLKDLEIKDLHGNTGFLNAIVLGNKEAVVKMLSKNEHLLRILDGDDKTPLCKAISFDQMEIAVYLYNQYGRRVFTVAQLNDAIISSIRADKYDFALLMLKDLRGLGGEREPWEALQILAEKSKAFSVTPGLFRRFTNYVLRRQSEVNPAIGIVDIIWGRQLNTINLSDEGEITSFLKDVVEILFIAAQSGNLKLLAILVSDVPESVNQLNENDLSIFHVAVLHGQKSVLRLLHEKGVKSEWLLDRKGDHNENFLHCAARYSSTSNGHFTWPVFQLQEELLNFMALEQLVRPQLRTERTEGTEGKTDHEVGATPRELFFREHNELIRTARSWMVTITGACLVASSLNATIVFTGSPSAIPGEEKRINGITLSPKFEEFVIQAFGFSYGISLITSTVSMYVFLKLMMSRYSLEDFVGWLRFELLLGQVFLLLSAISIAVEFSAVFLLSFHNRYGAVLFAIGGSAIVWNMATALLFWGLLGKMCGLLWQTIKLKLRSKEHLRIT